VIREAKPEEEFLRLASGVKADGSEVVFLAYGLGSQLCVENYQSHNFINTYCVEADRQIHELVFERSHLFLCVGGNTYILNEDLELIHKVGESLLDLVQGAAVFRSHSYDYINRQRLDKQPVWSLREEPRISIGQSETHLTIFKNDF
jgi:hypothetical protein